jgi:hypothetical protein
MTDETTSMRDGRSRRHDDGAGCGRRRIVAAEGACS